MAQQVRRSSTEVGWDHDKPSIQEMSSLYIVCLLLTVYRKSILSHAISHGHPHQAWEIIQVLANAKNLLTDPKASRLDRLIQEQDTIGSIMKIVRHIDVLRICTQVTITGNLIR